MEHETCNCHDCTQVRYRMSLQYQLDQNIGSCPMFDPNSLAQPSVLIPVVSTTRPNQQDAQ